MAWNGGRGIRQRGPNFPYGGNLRKGQRGNLKNLIALELIRKETQLWGNHGTLGSPEIEVYPETTGVYVEFWLPIKE